MKQQVFYIHGGSAYSDYALFLNYLRTVEINDPTGERIVPDRWTNRLREDLGSDYELFAPTMPNKYNSKYEEWKIWFERHFEWVRDDLVLVGWSQGGMFFTKYLLEETMPVSVKALILVATPYEAVDFYGENGGDFLFNTDQLAALASKVGEIHILHSTDDFVVPYTHAEQFAAALPTATLHTFTDKNHFLVPELPELIDLIKKLS